MSKLMVSFSISLWMTASVSMAQAVEVRRLTATDGERGDLMGSAVALSGDRMLVGAWTDDDQGAAAGSAYVFERDSSGNWQQVAKLLASDGEEQYYFGYAVALQGGLAIVGALRADDPVDFSGKAYVFERDAGGIWRETSMLSTGLPGGAFGYDVTLQGNRAVIGASGSTRPGAAFVYERDPLGQWLQVASMSPSAGFYRDYFGKSVAISGDRILVGQEAYSFFAGAAYVFERDAGGTWVERARLQPGDPHNRDFFGSRIALSGDRAVAGAPRADGRTLDSGAVYVFDRTPSGEWFETAKLVASDGERNDMFGTALAVSGRRILVGAPKDNHGSVLETGIDMGSVYVFDQDASGAWHETLELEAHDAANYDSFGTALALQGDRVLIGKGSSNVPGSVYEFDLEPLSVDVHELSLNSGGVQTLQLDAGSDLAGLEYRVLGSFSGTAPGITIPGGLHLPLDPDGYFLFTLTATDRPPLRSPFGQLDANGHGQAAFEVTSGMRLSLVGRTVNHAFVAFRPHERGVRFVSNPQSLFLVP